ncbi:LysR family transcriptional regulator [Brevibacillus dissolubilis]|uniref:LysR family transcriptional regulator n=1 Tax=Brevibacillus dissolubilis TaxID=1844116 RepID=UPI001116596A|nr:LysR family transcriptional regulator [Brevibacillus dissolubilis]
MELEQMRAFLAVVQTKNFTRAAALLHVTQSTITTRIKQMEQSLGNPLFVRTNKRVELTPTGHVVHTYVKRIMELVRECEVTTQLEPRYHERFVIGSTHSLWDYLLGPIVHKFREAHPKTAFRLVTGHSNEIIQMLLDGICDVGIVYVPPQNPGLEVNLLYSDEMILVAHPDLELPPTPLTAADLHTLPMMHLDWGSPYTEWFAAEMGHPHIPSMEIDHASLLLDFLTKGKGIGFVSRAVGQEYVESGKLVVVPYQAQLTMPARELYVVYPKHRQKAQGSLLRDWLDFLQERVEIVRSNQNEKKRSPSQ